MRNINNESTNTHTEINQLTGVLDNLNEAIRNIEGLKVQEKEEIERLSAEANKVD